MIRLSWLLDKSVIWVETLRKGNLNSLVFALSFWGWVFLVSVWIENAPVQSVLSYTPKEKYSQILFHQPGFTQTNEEGMQVTLSAIQARFDSESREMIVDRPTIQWQNPAQSKIVNATGERGLFYAEASESGLPAAFRYLIVSGSATVQGINSRVDSDTMIFDNEKRLFAFPGRFTFQKGNVKLDYQKMYYDPIQDKPAPLGAFLNEPELQTLLKTIGTSKP